MDKTRTSFLLILIFIFAATFLSGMEENRSQKTLNAAQKEAVIKETSEVLKKQYIFPDKAEAMASHLQKRFKEGAYDKLDDAAIFANQLSEDMRSISKDLHLGFHFDPSLAENVRRFNSRTADDAEKAREESLEESRKDNFGFRKIERLQGNIGYLDFRSFGSASAAGPTAIAALNFLAHCDAVIIDLRQNGGGDPTLIQLMSSYFFEQPTHLNDIYNREENTTEHYWTLPYVPGPKMDKADIYVLTSNRTFSGAEEFSYNMKNLKRATLIGETTGGGAHPTTSTVVQTDYVLFVPNARAINPITKTNWEGTGVTPDISVPAAEAFDRAYAMALEKLAQKTTDAQQKEQLNWLSSVIKSKTNPVRISEETMARYAGVYQDRKVTLENGVLQYQRRGPKYKMIPITETSFILDGLEDVRFEFVVKDGKATEIIGVYANGTREPSKRTS